MSQNDAEPEVACTLTAEGKAKRDEEVRSRLVSQYTGYQTHEYGVSIRFSGTDESLEAVAQFVAAELQCCSFADYEIAVSPPYDDTILTITGPPGTRQMFREGLVERLETESAVS